MEIKDVEHQSGHLVVRVSGRLDAASVVTFVMRLRRELDSTNGCLILDLGEVDFVDSTALGAIVGFYKRLQAERRKVILTRVGKRVARVLAITRLDRALPIAPSPRSAIEGGMCS